MNIKAHSYGLPDDRVPEADRGSESRGFLSVRGSRSGTGSNSTGLSKSAQGARSLNRKLYNTFRDFAENTGILIDRLFGSAKLFGIRGIFEDADGTKKPFSTVPGAISPPTANVPKV